MGWGNAPKQVRLSMRARLTLIKQPNYLEKPTAQSYSNIFVGTVSCGITDIIEGGDMKKVNFSKGQKVTIVAIICGLLFNPMSVEILEQYFKLAYTGISVVSTVWVVGYLLKKVLTPEKINIPKKSAKVQKVGKLIAT